MARRPKRKKSIEALTHDEESRKNIPTAELESVMPEADKTPIRIAYERRNRDLDPQLVWRGKDEQDEADLVVQAPPLYIQEKIHPKVLIDDLTRESRARAQEEEDEAPDLFADFNGLPNLEARTEFYQHDQNWSNRMILGDSLQVMASLAEREGLRGKVQCIYMDPPYGIKFNSNFQWSTTSRDVKDGKKEHVTREPEQVKAYRDTWRSGIHSYLTYLRDRLTVARSLLTDSGSIFVQIGGENVHRVRALMDEIFGEPNFVRLITFVKTSGQTDNLLASVSDYIVWFAKDRAKVKFRQPLRTKSLKGDGGSAYKKVRSVDGKTRRLEADDVAVTSPGAAERVYRIDNLTSQSPGTRYDVQFQGFTYFPKGYWKTQESSMVRLLRADRIQSASDNIYYIRYFDDYAAYPIADNWDDTSIAGFTSNKRYVVETSAKVIQRCLLMCTDPGDLVLDPTCGSGTSAYVSEQWGRRWITVDTSRVALTIARARLMGARYPYYLLADSRLGQLKEAEVARAAPSTSCTHGDIRQGFVYERVPHVTLKSIANNTEIDAIWDFYQPVLTEALADLSRVLKIGNASFQVKIGARQGSYLRFDDDEGEMVLPSGEVVPTEALLEWELPRDLPDGWPKTAGEPLSRFWEARIARQRKVDASIAAQAGFEYLYDRPYEDKGIVRVAGPFTVESLTPHRVVEPRQSLSEAASTFDEAGEARGAYSAVAGTTDESGYDFRTVILEQLRSAGVQQADRRRKIDFTSLVGWPGDYVCAEGRYLEGETERRASILVGPEHGTVGRGDLMAAARESGEAGFDVLISCAFNYDAQCTDVNKLGRLPILKARMNADLQMSTDLKTAKTGNLFVVFGEPDIEVRALDADQIEVTINGVDLFDPQTGDVRSSEAKDLACWFIDTDYDMASFFVRHAYFLGASDPYRSLKATLKAEIDVDAWQSLRSETSRPFDKPSSGRIAVKAINHLGDEVMKVVNVD